MDERQDRVVGREHRRRAQRPDGAAVDVFAADLLEPVAVVAHEVAEALLLRVERVMR